MAYPRERRDDVGKSLGGKNQREEAHLLLTLVRYRKGVRARRKGVSEEPCVF